MKIYRATQLTPQLVEAIDALLVQLSTISQKPTEAYMNELLGRPDIHLLIAERDGVTAGMLTLAIVDLPSSRKAWIEDVCTDEKMRGCGIGQALVERALDIAREEGAKKVYLTSNSSRQAAHRLYERCGFVKYDTTVFRVIL